jgi:hypothetical protein
MGSSFPPSVSHWAIVDWLLTLILSPANWAFTIKPVSYAFPHYLMLGQDLKSCWAGRKFLPLS